MSNWQEKNNQSCSYNFAFQKKRCKADWAGLSIGDAFKNDLDYYQRLPAQRVFYQLVDNAQKRVVEAMGVYSSGETQFMVKPQISPCYTNYPANLAAHSAIGLTAYLEFTARCEHSLLLTHMAEYLQDPATLDNASVDRATYARIARLVAETVQQRLVLEELSRVCILPSVEIHRLFGSSQQRLNFRTIKEVVQAVVLFGDVLPPWEPMNLHPLTRVIIRALERISGEYLDGLPQCQPQRFIYLGEAWVRRICKTLTAYLPLPRPEQAQGRTEKKLSMPEFLRSQADATSPARLEHSKPPTQTPEGLAPLEGPMPPSLGETGNAAQHVTNRLQMPGNGGDDGGGGQSALDEESQKALAEFSEAMDQAGGQSRDWEDMRSEIVESAMAQTAFQQGPITGSPTDGNEVIVNLPSGEFAGGRIFDRPLGLTNDSQAVENLKIQARPVTEQLRRNLYPSLDHRPQTLRLRTGGVLDGGRLALAGFCPAVFKRFRNVEMADKRGKPVLVIACDGSGSLNYNQMRMLKLLATAWLESIAGSEIQLLAGLYHSGSIRSGLTGPLVQWIYHPRKTPSFGMADSVRAVAALPDKGTGVQSDALSLSYIMSEARSLAKGDMIYMTIISDTAWNISFHGEMDGKQEVVSLLQELRKEFGYKLHTLLVALEGENVVGMEDVLDKLINVSAQQLADPASVARQIGDYVSNKLRQVRVRRNPYGIAS